MSDVLLPGAEPLSHDGGHSGVLVLHGFTSNPASMRSIAELAVAEGYSVELPRLPGHGTSVEDLATATWDDWTKTAEGAFDALSARCSRVAVVGLSMGAGLAAHVAEVRPAVVGGVLINPIVTPPPFELADGVRQLLEAGVETVESIGSDVKKEGVAESSYDATPLAPLLSLFAGIGGLYENLSLITAPVLLVTSREDHVVTWDNGTDLEARVRGPFERAWLENSYHVATIDNDRELLETMVASFLARVLA